jgi:hypothetical protein
MLLRSDSLSPEEPHDWQTHEFADAGARVEIPAAPRNVARVAGLRLSRGVLTAGTVLPGRGEEYAVLRTEIDPDRRKSASDDALVAEAVAALLNDNPPARKTTERPVRVNGFDGREVAYEVPERSSSGVVRVLVVGDRLFRVAVVGPGMTPDDERARRFLDSFAVTDRELLARAQAYAEVARPVGLATLTQFDPPLACAFDPARGAFWMVADRRLGGPPTDPLGHKASARQCYLRRYSYPGFRLEAEYRVGAPTMGMAIGGNRLYLTESPTSGGDPRFRTKPKVAAYDLRELPAADADGPPVLIPDARADVPGSNVRGLAADPAGRWVCVLSGGDYKEGFVSRVAADLSGTAATLAFPGRFVSHGASVSPDGTTVSVIVAGQNEGAWTDIDAAEWRVRRKESGHSRQFSATSWVRSEERTIAADQDGKGVYELRWGGRRVGDVNPVAAVPAWFLGASPDGRYLFCVCAPLANGEAATLRVFRIDVPLPPGTGRPVCASIPVEGISLIRNWFTVAPDGAAIVLSTGQVITVTYPPAH